MEKYFQKEAKPRANRVSDQFQFGYVPEILSVQSEHRTVVVNSCCGNEHITNKGVMTEAISFHQFQGKLENGLVNMNHRKFADMLLHQWKFLFVVHTAIKLGRCDTADIQVRFTQIFAYCPDGQITFKQLNNNIGVKDYHWLLRQACSRILSAVIGEFLPEPKVSQKAFFEKGLLFFSWIFSVKGCDSKAKTSTVFPTRESGNVMDTLFLTGVIVSRCTLMPTSALAYFLPKGQALFLVITISK